MENKLWAERYRPKSLDEYVWINQDQRDQVESWVREQELPMILLLSGGPGCGKSSLAQMLMREMNVDDSDIKWVNASMFTGVDNIRSLVGFVETMPSGKYRYVILDEADRLSVNAQDMLKSMTEEYSAVCRWIFTTNRPHMITKPLQSRMQGFHVSSLDREQFMTKVASILIQEGIEVNETNWDILDSYVSSSYPDLRRCINLLQQNCKTGVLKAPSNSGTTSNEEAMVEAVTLFKEGKITAARQILSGKLADSDYEELYRLLYRNLNWWGNDATKQNQAIVVIANRLRDHTLVADPEINCAAALVELEMIRNS